jgi:lysozyme
VASELDKKVPWWRGFSLPRQAVLLNMAFNMGVPKFLGFKRFLAAAEVEDCNAAAYEMGDSKWAEQVVNRSRELITQMCLGAWQEA